MTIEQKLFELIDSIGEITDGAAHVIDVTNTSPIEGERQYRVYHSSGYCFDIYKVAEDQDENTGDILKWEYGYYNEWYGFEKIDAETALSILKNHFSKHA